MSETIPSVELDFPDIAVELKKELFVDGHTQMAAHGNIADSFKAVDDAYTVSPEAYLRWMRNGVSRVQPNGRPIHLAHLANGSEQHSEDLVVTFSPLNDGAPQSDVPSILRFIEDGGTSSKQKAAPNSWGPLTKLAVGYEFGRAEGLGAQHLQIFAPEKAAFTTGELAQLRWGDSRPYGELLRDAIQAGSWNHGNEHTFSRIHLVAAGMCGKALGAAMFMLENPSDDYELASVSLQNLSIGKKALQAAGNYMRQTTVEQPVPTMPEDFVGIPEPLIRQHIDGHGAEFAMQLRVARGLRDMAPGIGAVGRAGFTYKNMPRDIARLVNAGIPLSVANAVDEGLNQATQSFLQDVGGVDWIDIHGKDGSKVGQLVNEQSTVMALTANRGISRALSGGQYPSAL